ncbi:uncharacterized protein SCDLUD_001343 [Saccharomycodes ludwigii]|uniref:uncharacterized protein n=1 Tax=Saccharomycodes ludwigii TaxID=36035 RepID=UPI001E858C71|nr:hypothetical protein SCDLUD_001343 [Saccharomycodes ludwigii]KAH3901580.1 hypothetical protein SCDLUD_001343 [Saccharomycodes ludwigii]
MTRVSPSKALHYNATDPPIQRCSGFWNYDDITTCGRIKYIHLVLPLLLMVVLGGFTLYKIFIHYLRYKNSDYTTSETTERTHLLRDSNNGELYINEPNIANNNKASSDLKNEHFSIMKLKLTQTDGAPHGISQIITRSFAEKSRVIVEFFLVVIQFFLHGYIFCTFRKNQNLQDFTFPVSITNFTLWAWLLIVSTLRLLNINQNVSWCNNYPGNLWAVSFTSYMFMFLGSLLPFRSVLIGNIVNPILIKYYTSQFIVCTTLFLLLFTAKIKNGLPLIYKTDPNITPSPEPVTSILSFVSWSWLNGFVWNAHLRPVTLKDIWGLRIDDYAVFVLRKFKLYCEHKKDSKYFSRNLILFFGKFLGLQGFWACLESVIDFFPTLLLKRILEYVENQNSAPKNLAWFYVVCMLVCRLFAAVFSGQALFFGRRVCIRMKAIIISEIYSKALRRKIMTSSSKPSTDAVDPQELNDESSVDGDEESSTSSNLGGIINLMAVDAFKVSEVCAYLHSFVQALVMTVVALTLLYKLLGWSALIGASLMILLLPITFRLANWLGDLQRKNLAVTDKRIQKLNETFQAIRIIKFFSWEENFERDLISIRDEELKLLLYRSLVWSCSAFVWFITPSIVTSASFAFYIYVQRETLTTPVAFTALSLFTLLRNPLDQLSDMLSFVIQSKVSLDRVQDFLNEEDTAKYDQLTISHDKLGFQNATVAWDNGNNQFFKLKNLNIDFKIGKLNVVIGPTGSGKTSLLMGLLGEMDLLEGKVFVPSLDPRDDLVIEADGMTNSIAYCSQAAWLLNDTVKNNILFNSPYNEERYHAVVEACGLKRDFEILNAGDQTEIGEKGITLSGGQKQRVSLARALYSFSRHLLLDDCLSAVDSHTALWIYENCISGPLMENRTCILVSHNVALTLKNAHWVVILENGKVKDQGEPLELLNRSSFGDDEFIKTSILSKTASSVNLASKSAVDLKNSNNTKDAKPVTKRNDIADQIKAKEGKLIEEETKSNGVVSIDVYKWFAKLFGGWKMVLFLACVFIVANGTNIWQSWWVRNWASHNIPSAVMSVIYNIVPKTVSGLFITDSSYEGEIISVAESKETHSTKFYLLIYFGIGVLYATLSAAKSIINFIAGINASRKIFVAVLEKVLYAKLRFFDSTPIGRIMNRFSKDIESVDQELTPFVEGAFISLVQCISTIFLIGYITPGFLIIAILIGFMYYLVGYFYLCGSRELKRFESISRSPIHQHFSETLVGVTTIRAFGDERRFMLQNLNKIDENNKPFFFLWVANRWLAFRVDLIGALVIFFSGCFIMLNIKNLDAGLAGISLTYAISFTDSALWLVRLYSNVEMTMNSVERLKEYMDIEQEPQNKDGFIPPADWPSEGKIDVTDLSLRYAPNLPKVIKNVSFTVEPSSKVGIVGRTGAGKSTIITALFRFLDPETGYIKIDNVDITSIPLKRLRQSITIIPQDPTLFSGTLKTNLDPYDEFSDDSIYEALTRVNLITPEELDSKVLPSNGGTDESASITSENTNKFLDLTNEVTEGGSNLSQGQRQLVCLARSILRSPKVMLLDEATASIDYKSDAKIQQTIREEFRNSTILTIAHRLRSIIDYDKILVMDAGEVKEYDHPYSLLLNKDSIFYSMCEDSGELDALIQLSKESFVSKLNSK